MLLRNKEIISTFGCLLLSHKSSNRKAYALNTKLQKLIANEISKHIPNFKISYNPDFRQSIADSWPCSIDDKYAKNDWGWNLKYNLKQMTSDMIKNLKSLNKINV